MTIYKDAIGGDHQTATYIVAASNSPHQAKADYVCDGTADQVQIQAALDALPNNGGRVILLEGTFTINDTIHLYRDVVQWFNVFIEGQGLKSTTIELAAGSNCDMIDVNVLNNDSGWKGVAEMMLDGNESGQSSGHGIHAHKSGTGSMFDMRFKNVFVYDVKQNGFHINGGWGVYIDNCLTEYSGGHGLYLLGHESYIYGFHASVNGGNGIELINCTQLHVSHCRITSVDVGIRLENVSESIISDNTINTFGFLGGDRIGIYVLGTSHYNSIHDNVIKGDGANSAHGIFYEATGTIPDNIHHNQIDECPSASLIIGSSGAYNANFQNNILSNATNALWFWGDVTHGHIITDNYGLNPYGVRASPFDNTNHVIAPYKAGLAAGPTVSSQDYKVVITPCRVISTGGTGVSIVIKDVAGNTICSPGATCDEELEIGWKINFGAFSAAPTVKVIFK